MQLTKLFLHACRNVHLRKIPGATLPPARAPVAAKTIHVYAFTARAYVTLHYTLTIRAITVFLQQKVYSFWIVEYCDPLFNVLDRFHTHNVSFQYSTAIPKEQAKRATRGPVVNCMRGRNALPWAHERKNRDCGIWRGLLLVYRGGIRRTWRSVFCYARIRRRRHQKPHVCTGVF